MVSSTRICSTRPSPSFGTGSVFTVWTGRAASTTWMGSVLPACHAAVGWAGPPPPLGFLPRAVAGQGPPRRTRCLRHRPSRRPRSRAVSPPAAGNRPRARNDAVPSRPPISSNAAATCTSRCVSTPPVTRVIVIAANPFAGVWHRPAGTADKTATGLYDRLLVGHSARPVGARSRAPRPGRQIIIKTARRRQPVVSSQTRPGCSTTRSHRTDDHRESAPTSLLPVPCGRVIDRSRLDPDQSWPHLFGHGKLAEHHLGSRLGCGSFGRSWLRVA